MDKGRSKSKTQATDPVREFLESLDPKGELLAMDPDLLKDIAKASYGEEPSYKAILDRMDIQRRLLRKESFRGYTFLNVRNGLPPDLSRMDLQDCQFFRVAVRSSLRAGNLARSRFYQAPITGNVDAADFTSAHLEGQDFSRRVLLRTRFSAAEMIGCNFSYSTLRGVSLKDADLTAAQLVSAVVENWKEHSRSQAADLSGVNLYLANASQAAFRDIFMPGSAMPEAILQDVEFVECDLRFANLFRAILTGAKVSRGCMRYCSLDEVAAYDSESGKSVQFEGVDLSGASLSGGLLVKARFMHCDLTGCDFTNADISQACFQGSNMRGAIMNEETEGWGDADFKGAFNIREMDFGHAAIGFGEDFLKQHVQISLPPGRPIEAPDFGQEGVEEVPRTRSGGRGSRRRTPRSIDTE